VRLARFTSLVATGLALAACGGGGGGGDADAGSAGPSFEAHVLARAGYGPDAWSEQRIAALGADAYLDEQLHPASIPDDALEARLAAYPSLGQELQPLLENYEDEPFEPILELIRAKLLRSALSHRQLEQVLVDFWFDHFNVYGADGFTNFAVVPYERRAIRPFVLGRFEDLLGAVARNAAMLYYLDNYLSSREGFVFEGEERGINENWARELLELHTVGVDGGYTQQDVIEVARAFTGWTIGPAFLSDVDGFFFWNAAHDPGAKQVMQLSLPAGRGVADGLGVVAYLASHPKTARFVCTRLVQRFVSETPPARLVEECASVYLSSDGDLRSVTRAILFSSAFRDPAVRGAKVKRPLVFVASLARASGIALEGDLLDGLVFYAGLLGEALYQAHPPTGYPDDSAYWASGGTLVSRLNLVSLLTDADLLLGIDWGVTTGTSAEIVDALVSRLLSGSVASDTREAAISRVDALGAVPDPVRVREAAALLLSSPDFMRH
jgi:uncharacterized protein (DUF1800 family)